MGLGEIGAGPLVYWSLTASLAVLAAQFLFLLGRFRLRIRETPLLHQLLPRTGLERVVFGFLSLAAGFGEEIAFRGFAIPGLVLLTGSVEWSALISSVAFGALHGYQGWVGVLRTGVMGLVLACSFILSGSLWPGILAHVALDLISGLFLGKILLREI
jgi:membrane protease YdiL (CAAX protease family)